MLTKVSNNSTASQHFEMLLFIEESMNAGRDAFLSGAQIVKMRKIASGILAGTSSADLQVH
ncbi:hypothetical protein [Methyloversatilis discipulorum]|uniref:hypothetical protein n=1 Tax=Methyloversatilis discipulorum TaxID=1119528 RepID=UPI003F2CF406